VILILYIYEVDCVHLWNAAQIIVYNCEDFLARTACVHFFYLSLRMRVKTIEMSLDEHERDLYQVRCNDWKRADV